MDCSKTEVFFTEWSRMCSTFPIGETNACPMKVSEITSLCSECKGSVFASPERAIKIVQEWSDAHPQKTRLSVFLEAFPKAEMNDNGYPQSCAGYIFGFGCDAYCDDDCIECWNTPVEG